MKRRTLFGILAVGWMLCIFFFSARNDVESEQDSHLASRVVASILEPDFEEWEVEEQEELIRRIDFPVRKAAHASEFAILALLWLGVFWPDDRERKGRAAAAAFLAAVCYAVTDEFHQLFVPGRSGQPTDVLIDSLGAAAGLLMFFLVWSILGLCKKKKQIVRKGSI